MTPYQGPVVNWGRDLEQLKKLYETPPARGVSHGLQKDAIQNGWGARISNSGWSYEFRLVRFPNKILYLTMTDSGAWGLAGKVYTSDEIKAMGTDDLPTGERLARFEAVYESGGNEGPGLYGRGKLLFNAVSKQSRILYDSLTKDSVYRLGRRYVHGRQYEQLPKIFEGMNAQSTLSEWTGGGLRPLQKSGTRITIIDPLDEIVESINDGSFLKAIEETWWEIIKKYAVQITVVKEDGTFSQAKVPDEYGGPPTPAEQNSSFKTCFKDNLEVEAGSGDKLNVKHIYLYVAPHDLPEPLQGVAIHRRGMKVGIVNFLIPEKLRPRFFGYVQLPEQSENMLALAEDLCHYSFNARQSVYRNLRNEVQMQAENFFEKLGFGRRSGDPNESEKKLLEQAVADLNAVLNEMDVPGLGSGESSKKGIFLSVKGLPDGLDNVKEGTKISGFWYVLKNSYSSKRTVKVEVFTSERDKGEIDMLLRPKEVELKPDEEWETDKFSFVVAEPDYPRQSKIVCNAKATQKGKTIAHKRFYIYFDVEKPEPPKELVTITLESAQWPKPNSYRVDYGQSIKNLKYEIENGTSLHLKTKVRLYTVFVEGKQSIETYLEQDVEFDPSESKQISVDEVKITQEKYAQVDKGKMLLRCSVVALEQSPPGYAPQWTKGTRLAECDRTFWLNMDPSYGFFDDQDIFVGGPNEPRSKVKRTDSDRGWVFSLNATHPAYVVLSGDEVRQKDYCFEEMARKVVYVLLKKNNYQTLKNLAGLDSSEHIEDLPPEEILDTIGYRIADRFLAEHYK